MPAWILLRHWLPELTLRNLRVGDSKATIHFYRKSNGTSSYRVLDKQGSLHILRQPSPWSLTTSYAERLMYWFSGNWSRS